MCRYELIVDTAFHGAHAIARGHTEDGDPMARTMSDTFMRCEPMRQNPCWICKIPGFVVSLTAANVNFSQPQSEVSACFGSKSTLISLLEYASGWTSFCLCHGTRQLGEGRLCPTSMSSDGSTMQVCVAFHAPFYCTKRSFDARRIRMYSLNSCC